MRNALLISSCMALTLLFVFPTIYANDVITGKVGSGVGTILGNQDLTKLLTKITKAGSLSTPESSAVVQAAAAIQLSDILGMYELVSCTVNYSDGSSISCNQLTFSGDMAITPHNTMWQRISFSGVQPIVASGVFTLSNNTITVVNDLSVGTSVIQLGWDGQNLTTFIQTSTYNETDVWRRIMAPPSPCPTISDADGDGVIDQWDKCSGTPAGSCVDKTGCPTDIPRCVNMVPTYNLLLDNQ